MNWLYVYINRKEHNVIMSYRPDKPTTFCIRQERGGKWYLFESDDSFYMYVQFGMLTVERTIYFPYKTSQTYNLQKNYGIDI